VYEAEPIESGRVGCGQRDADGTLFERWLIAQWPDDNTEPVKCWLSSLPADTERMKTRAYRARRRAMSHAASPDRHRARQREHAST
jgi:hypothetical protein